MTDYTDPTVTRKLNMLISRAGLGVHPGHEILLFDLGKETTCSEEIQQVILDLAIIHYELDFAIVSTTAKPTLPLLENEDNVYFLSVLTEELEAYLQHLAKVTITPDSVDLENVEVYKKSITSQYDREGFARNEHTRPGVFKIVSQSKKDAQPDESGDVKNYVCNGE